MCYNKNGAPFAQRYINAQLAVLHANAKECLSQTDHQYGGREQDQAFYALAEFTVTSHSVLPSQAPFHACFKPPVLDFICDHDVMLRLTFERGHFVLDGFRGIKGQTINIPADLTVDIRLNHTMKAVANDLKVDGHDAEIKVLVLDFKRASVVSIKPELEGRDAFIRYISQYLKALHGAGNDVLFSLPRFSQHPAMEIDFTVASDLSDFAWQDAIYGITTTQINQYLASQWLKSALLSHTELATDVNSWELRALAQYDKYDPGSYFRLKFGTPTVEVLCAKEVIVYFDLDSLEFFNDEDFSDDSEPETTFRKWKIAFVMNVIENRDSEEHCVTLSLDLSKPRYHEGLSDYPGLMESESEEDEWRQRIVSFIRDEYLKVLHSVQYHVIYFHHARMMNYGGPIIDPADMPGGGKPTLGGGSPRETIGQAKMFSFDQVIAISQASINLQLSALSHTLLRVWAHGTAFTATFKPLSLQLLSDKRAIVWVHLASGELKTLHERQHEPWTEGPLHQFQNWVVAFEVDLKMCNHANLEGRHSETLRQSAAFQKHGAMEDRELKHVYFDLSNAQYLHEYSYYGNLVDFRGYEEGHSRMLQLEATIWYLKLQYFRAIREQSLHVLSSIPVFKSGNSLPSYALTSVTFQVYSNKPVTSRNWMHVPAKIEPILVILGMSGWRPLPADRLEYSTNWVVQPQRGGASHGTIGISHRIFTQDRLFHLLSTLNALTTLIPVVFNPLLGFHGVNLKTWAEHEQRKDRPSDWQLVSPATADHTKYLWEHSEEWRYKLSGNGEIDATQTISCVTRNHVELPRIVKNGALHIKVGGRVDLSLTLQKGSAKPSSASSSIVWSTNVALQTIGNGIKVTTPDSQDPTVTNSVFSGSDAEELRNPADMLRKAFPSKVDLHELVEDIRAFEGTWEFCYPPAIPYSLANPIFNDDGDLMFELRCIGRPIGRTPGLLSPAGRDGRTKSPLTGNGPTHEIRSRGSQSPTPAKSE
ncbi:hypothetical protein PYCCODRAFT_1358933 [Trametes coccinea BRFM310]|uniref:Uncharacterized protein n=1 Tax=Trametes coccinea (strain BRFM310) TaxID=1353009 RepID=A0A1Y2J172_TRAC3|nr:hypothetical protein PYCCODRAFT_1358933 [Trametes coccinea BRFM310]